MKIRVKNIDGYFIDYIQSVVLKSLFYVIMLIPFRIRLKIFGTIMSKIIAPSAGYDQRIRGNLQLVMPNLSPKTIKSLMQEVPKSVGHTLIEIFSGNDFKKRAKKARITGGGLKELENAISRKQGVILVSGHLGNYDVPRAVLSELGYNVGALYKPFKNPFFNAYYHQKISEISEPVISSTDRNSLGQMVKLLKSGGMIGMLIDVQKASAPRLTFFGKPATTATSAAKLALKYNLALVPTYGIRLDDDGNFELIIEHPIPHSTPELMTQKINDSLERRARDHMEQYFWIHRRWKYKVKRP